MTRQLLTFSRGGEPVKEKMRIEEIIRESAVFITQGSKVKCFFDFQDGLWPVEIDKSQISQVIQNLVLNAIQAMPEGGRIDFTVSNFRNPDKGNLLLDPDGLYLRIKVKDQGGGIKKEDMKNIVDPYFSTKKVGSGLGLSICHSIIKKHNGIIEVDSKPGEGAEFVIYLPANPVLIVQNRRKNELKMKLPEIFSVLLMDVEKSIRDLSFEIFKILKIKVDFAVEGKEAIMKFRTARKNSEMYDLVVMDLPIPNGMGGKEAIIELRKIDPSMKVIVSNGYFNDPVLSEFKKYGFNGVLFKPYGMEEMIKAIKSVF
ncbi:MAG: response regulator [Spirochaetales bacterium]|nr:response regulator [Spirochaetales bacterium]